MGAHYFPLKAKTETVHLVDQGLKQTPNEFVWLRCKTAQWSQIPLTDWLSAQNYYAQIRKSH